MRKPKFSVVVLAPIMLSLSFSAIAAKEPAMGFIGFWDCYAVTGPMQITATSGQCGKYESTGKLNKCVTQGSVMQGEYSGSTGIGSFTFRLSANKQDIYGTFQETGETPESGDWNCTRSASR